MSRPWICAVYKNGRSESIQIGGPAIDTAADLEWLTRALALLADDFAEPDPQPELAAAMDVYAAPVK